MNDYRAMSKIESSDQNTGHDLVKPDQSVAPEKHPNLTLLESGQNPGEMLRSARERAGLSLADISAQTKINERQLLAIESGDVSRLPPETFAKAFIKSYCRALKMDPVPVILSFGFSESGVADRQGSARSVNADAGRVDPFEPKMPDSSKRLSTLNFDRRSGKKSLSYMIVFAAVAVMAAFYVPVFLSNQSGDVVEAEPLQAETAAALESQGGSTGDIPAGQAGVAAQAGDQQGQPGMESVFPALQQAASAEAATATGGDSAGSSANPAVNAQVNPAPQAQPQAAAPQATPPATQAATPASAALPAATPSGNGLLKFAFQEQSWVTVRDASDQVLVSQLNEGGSSLEVRGTPPFKLIVGNAKSVKVTNNGKAVDLNTNIRGEVARITVQ